MSKALNQRIRLNIQGQVQGVGFRPAVYRYANKYSLTGWAANTAEGLLIEVQGKKSNIDAFIGELKHSGPLLANITSLKTKRLPPAQEREFTIHASRRGKNTLALIPPDICTCKACFREISDKKNRRYKYPFTNCVDCGPRFTIIKNIPYDRPNTTMKAFRMCPACLKEYNNPKNRRFHAQPNACPECGPEIQLVSKDRKTIGRGDEALEKTAGLISGGKILAIKGLGGFHLACDAFNDGAVRRLRSGKYREDKPFALMAGSVKTVRKYCFVSAGEQALLLSSKRPVVLLKKLGPDMHSKKQRISAAVAPNNEFLGFMLPYTPLHRLLFDLLPGTGPLLVMTSGNISDEPICYTNESAFAELKGIADYFLVNNRDIHVRCDDSVTRLSPQGGTREMILRRSRGYAPSPLNMNFNFRSHILACGAGLKNTFSLSKNRSVFVSHHIGDLENAETLGAFENAVEHYKRLFDINPAVIAHDMHPEYLSTKYALNLSGKNLRFVPVQHHHAHIVSCMADNNLPDEKVIGVAFDGLGYGEAGDLRGAEFLVCGFRDFSRAAHLSYIPMPGGTQAIKEPWRMACMYLYEAFGDGFLSLNTGLIRKLNIKSWVTLKEMASKNVNSPLSSSMGRLFDAVSSILDIRQEINYEGEAAVELEQLAAGSKYGESSKYRFGISEGSAITIDPIPLIRAIVSDMKKNAPKEAIAARFHRSVARMILETCRLIRKQSGIKNVVLSGGVFQNMLLLKYSYNLLSQAGFRVYSHSKVPANDGGISLGQAVVANFIK